MHHTIWGWNDKDLDDDLFVDVDPINYEACLDTFQRRFMWKGAGNLIEYTYPLLLLGVMGDFHYLLQTVPNLVKAQYEGFPLLL